QVAVSPNPSCWLLLNASPDLRQQILSTPDLNPSSATRGTPISTVLLTSADVDSVMGLLLLREFQPLHILNRVRPPHSHGRKWPLSRSRAVEPARKVGRDASGPPDAPRSSIRAWQERRLIL